MRTDVNIAEEFPWAVAPKVESTGTAQVLLTKDGIFNLLTKTVDPKRDYYRFIRHEQIEQGKSRFAATNGKVLAVYCPSYPVDLISGLYTSPGIGAIGLAEAEDSSGLNWRRIIENSVNYKQIAEGIMIPKNTKKTSTEFSSVYFYVCREIGAPVDIRYFEQLPEGPWDVFSAGSMKPVFFANQAENLLVAIMPIKLRDEWERSAGD